MFNFNSQTNKIEEPNLSHCKECHINYADCDYCGKTIKETEIHKIQFGRQTSYNDSNTFYVCMSCFDKTLKPLLTIKMNKK